LKLQLLWPRHLRLSQKLLPNPHLPLRPNTSGSCCLRKVKFAEGRTPNRVRLFVSREDVCQRPKNVMRFTPASPASDRLRRPKLCVTLRQAGLAPADYPFDFPVLTSAGKLQFLEPTKRRPSTQ
jgi:hypothetical protein